MPIPKNHHDFPAPSGILSNLNRVTPGAVDPSRLARMWRPIAGALMEGVLSTLSRFALRLIDRTDGNAYSADELEAKVIASSGNRSAGTPVYAEYAFATLTGTTIAAGNVVIIDGITYTFVTALTEDTGDDTPYEVLVGATDSDSLDNLIAAVTADTGEGTLYGSGTIEHSTVTGEPGDGDTLTFQTKVPGLAGNSIAISDTLDAGGFAEATMLGGSDATIATAGDQLFDVDFLYTALVDMDVTALTGWGKSAIAAL